MALDPATTRFVAEMLDGADPDAKPFQERTPEEARAGPRSAGRAQRARAAHGARR